MQRPIPYGYKPENVSRDRNGTRWTVYGLPGGWMVARRAGDDLDPARFRHAVPLVTIRADLTNTIRTARRVAAAQRWALRAYVLA